MTLRVLVSALIVFWSKYLDSVLVSALVVFRQSALMVSLCSSALIVF